MEELPCARSHLGMGGVDSRFERKGASGGGREWWQGGECAILSTGITPTMAAGVTDRV
jgi:hypothetical protein